MINDFLDLITLPARKRIAAQNLEIAKQRIAHDMVVFAEEADTAYYTYQARRQAAGRLAVVVDVNEAAADVAQRQFNAGNINSLTLQTEQFAQDESRINLAKIKAQARADRERLNRLMGLSGNQAAANIDADLPSLPEKDPSLEDVESIALSRRLDLAAAQGEVQLAAYAIKLKRSTRYIPGVNVGINAERDVDRAWVIGPTLDLEIPLFDQGQPEMAKLAARYRQARRHFEALSVDIRSEAREARDALLAAREAASLHQQVLLPRTQKILSESLLHYNGMQLGNYELLLAKQREAAEEQSAIEAQRDYWIARAKLRTAMGGDAPQTAHP